MRLCACAHIPPEIITVFHVICKKKKNGVNDKSSLFGGILLRWPFLQYLVETIGRRYLATEDNDVTVLPTKCSIVTISCCFYHAALTAPITQNRYSSEPRLVSTLQVLEIIPYPVVSRETFLFLLS